MCILLLCMSSVCCSATNSSTSYNSATYNSTSYSSATNNSTSYSRWLKHVDKWKHLSDFTFRADRVGAVLQALTNASGIYIHNNVTSTSLHDVNREVLAYTVVVFVVECNDPTDTQESYRQYLFNMICFLRTYNLKAVLYLITENDRIFDLNRQEIMQFYPYLFVLPYPYSQFWSLIASKQSGRIFKGPGRGSYDGQVPSFSKFGALPMLVPLLEVLEHGHHAIYFDIDLAFIQDPIPYFFHGNNDILLGLELRSCLFPSLQVSPGWSHKEPNTGTMFLSSSPKVIRFFRNFLDRIIFGNWMNDQKQFFSNITNLKWSKTCDLNFDHANHLIKWEHDHNSSGTDTSDHIRYCFLNEFLIRNGFMDIFCQHGKRHGVKVPHYDLFMAAMTAPLYWRRSNDLERYSVDHVIRNISDTQFPLPVILHVNYCGDKMKCFRDRNLWLHRLSSQSQSSSSSSSSSSSTSYPRRHMCVKYHPRQTIYSAYNWTQHLLVAVAEFKAALGSLLPGRLYKFPSSPSVFLFANSTLQSFYNLRTFLHLKYSFKEVAVLSNPYFLMVPLGSTIKLDEQSNRIVFV